MKIGLSCSREMADVGVFPELRGAHGGGAPKCSGHGGMACRVRGPGLQPAVSRERSSADWGHPVDEGHLIMKLSWVAWEDRVS